MNRSRFIIILTVYVVILVLALTIVPFNVTFHGQQQVGGVVINEELYIDCGLIYKFVGTAEYDNNAFYNSDDKHYLGSFQYKPNVLMLISEIVSLTAVFAAISYILAIKNSHPRS